MSKLFGSIEISKVPKDAFKKVEKKDGTVATYLTIEITERKEPSQYRETHTVKFVRPKDQRIEGESTFFGGLKSYENIQQGDPTAKAQPAPIKDEGDLPF